jgi:hypothetical protein
MIQIMTFFPEIVKGGLAQGGLAQRVQKTSPQRKNHPKTTQKPPLGGAFLGGAEIKK